MPASHCSRSETCGLPDSTPRRSFESLSAWTDHFSRRLAAHARKVFCGDVLRRPCGVFRLATIAEYSSDRSKNRLLRSSVREWILWEGVGLRFLSSAFLASVSQYEHAPQRHFLGYPITDRSILAS